MTAKIIRHKFQSAVADGTDATLVKPSDWNSDHDLWLGYRVVTVGPDSISNADNLTFINYNVAGNITASLPAPTTGPPATFPLGWNCKMRVTGGGSVALNLTGGATINSLTALTLYQGDVLEIVGTGTPNYFGILDRRPRAARFGGILAYQDATHLTFMPFDGNCLKLNGMVRPVPTSGITGLTTTGVFVNAVAGRNLAASANYYVYVFDNNGTLTADFRNDFSHATSTTPGNEGTEIMSGDDTRSLLGFVRINASSQFQDDATARLVRTWFGRERPLQMIGPQDVNISVTANQIYTPIGALLYFLTWASETVMIGASGFGANTVGQTTWYQDIAIDGSRPAPGISVTMANSKWIANAWGPDAQAWCAVLAEGFHNAQVMVLTFAPSVGGSTNIYSQISGSIG